MLNTLPHVQPSFIAEPPLAPSHRALVDPALSGLQPIEPHHAPLFRAAVAEAGATGWTYFFPYLQLFGAASENRRLFFEELDGSIAIYRYWYRPTKQAATVSLFVPPFPWNEELMRRALERTAGFNPDGRQRVTRIAEDQAPLIEALGLKLKPNMDEYIYDRAAVAEAHGSEFASLRRKLSQLHKISPVVRPYSLDDRAPCEQLLKDWRAHLSERGVNIGPYRLYARKCLREFENFPGLLHGEVIEVAGQIAAFTFGGPIGSHFGSVFITVSSHYYPASPIYNGTAC